MKTWIMLTKEEQIERWENAKRVLEGLDEHARARHFDMSHWGQITACGTVACAAGFCSMDAWFIERGFEGRMNEDKELRIKNREGMFGNHWGSAVTDFFGHRGSDRIFFQPHRRSVEVVIGEIENHIQELRVPPIATPIA